MAQLSDRDPAAAQFTLEQLLESTPDSAAVHHLLAMSAVGSGDVERGQQELQRALELDENFLPSRIALARLALANRSMDEFEGHLARLEAQAPQNPDVLILRAAAAAFMSTYCGASSDEARSMVMFMAKPAMRAKPS